MSRSGQRKDLQALVTWQARIPVVLMSELKLAHEVSDCSSELQSWMIDGLRSKSLDALHERLRKGVRGTRMLLTLHAFESHAQKCLTSMAGSSRPQIASLGRGMPS